MLRSDSGRLQAIFRLGGRFTPITDVRTWIPPTLTYQPAPTYVQVPVVADDTRDSPAPRAARIADRRRWRAAEGVN